MSTVETSVNETMNWMNSKMLAQSKLGIAQDPAVKVAEIIQKIQVSDTVSTSNLKIKMLLWSKHDRVNKRSHRQMSGVWCLLYLQELEEICSPVVNQPKPKPEESVEDNRAHNGPAAGHGADGKSNQQTKNHGEMEVNWTAYPALLSFSLKTPSDPCSWLLTCSQYQSLSVHNSAACSLHLCLLMSEFWFLFLCCIYFNLDLVYLLNVTHV